MTNTPTGQERKVWAALRLTHYFSWVCLSLLKCQNERRSLFLFDSLITTSSSQNGGTGSFQHGGMAATPGRMNHLCLHATFIFVDDHRFLPGAELFPCTNGFTSALPSSPWSPDWRLLHWAYWLCSFILTCGESQGKSSSACINIGSSQRRVWRGWRGEQQVRHNGDGRERKAQRKCSDRQRN